MKGARVLEVGSSLTAHYVGRQLAALGAEVLKVEPPEGDPSRRNGPFVRDTPHPDGSALFLYLNAGKRGITVDRSTPTGRAIVGRLAARADIVLWGDDTATGQEAAAAVEVGRTAVWMLISPYGATGPRAGWSAYSLNIFHAGGEGYLLPGGLAWLAYPDREPIKAAGYVGEFSAGDSIVGACMLALLMDKPQDGPRIVDASIQEALLQVLRQEAWEYRADGNLPTRASRSMAIAGQMPTKDGWVEMVPATEKMVDSIFEWMGRPAWTQEYPTSDEQRAHGQRITPLLADWTVQHTSEELVQGGYERGVAVGHVLEPSQILGDPQLAAREFFAEIDHPHAGRLKYPLLAYRFEAEGDTPAPLPRPAPLLGEHNVEVLEGLDFSRREISALYEAGII